MEMMSKYIIVIARAFIWDKVKISESKTLMCNLLVQK